MNHIASVKFWERYNALPPAIQELADKNFRLLKSNPRHGSLQFKSIGSLWSVRVGSNYRALARPREKELVWFWIGSHSEYDRLIS